MNMRQDPEGYGPDIRDDLERRLRDEDFATEFREARRKASLGLKIARLRNAKGMSQTELAHRLDTTQSVISRYESSDYTSYRLDTLRRLADALGAELIVDLELSERGRRG